MKTDYKSYFKILAGILNITLVDCKFNPNSFPNYPARLNTVFANLKL